MRRADRTPASNEDIECERQARIVLWSGIGGSMFNLSCRCAVVALPLVLSACAVDVDDSDPAIVPDPSESSSPTGEGFGLSALTGAVSCFPSDSPYDCAPPATDNRSGPRVVYDKAIGSLDWPISDNTTLYNGIGVPLVNVTTGSVKINYGQRKVVNGQAMVYAWDAQTIVGLVSGWIHESQVQNRALLDSRSPTVQLPDPGQGDYSAIRVITGGDPSSIAGLKVSPSDVGGENGTDYLVRPSGVVNMTYNTPVAASEGTRSTRFLSERRSVVASA
jgi:hypothetical protein